MGAVSPEYRVQSVSVSWTVSLQQCTMGAVSPEYRVQSVSVSWTVSLQQCTMGAVSAQSTECSLSVGQFSVCSSLILWELCRPIVQSAACICQCGMASACSLETIYVRSFKVTKTDIWKCSVAVWVSVKLLPKSCTAGNAYQSEASSCQESWACQELGGAKLKGWFHWTKILLHHPAHCSCPPLQQEPAHRGTMTSFTMGAVSPEYRVQSVSVSWTVSLQQCTMGLQPRVQSAVCICQLDSQLAAVHYGCCVSPEAQSAVCQLDSQFAAVHYGSCVTHSTECSLYLSVWNG